MGFATFIQIATQSGLKHFAVLIFQTVEGKTKRLLGRTSHEVCHLNLAAQRMSQEPWPS